MIKQTIRPGRVKLREWKAGEAKMLEMAQNK